VTQKSNCCGYCASWTSASGPTPPPLGHGFLTGTIRSTEQWADDDWRKTNPRFTGENFQHNLRIVEESERVRRSQPLH
jgi:aryl-alcohol dehydrogenase-like predicted oxidoreductase